MKYVRINYSLSRLCTQLYFMVTMACLGCQDAKSIPGNSTSPLPIASIHELTALLLADTVMIEDIDRLNSLKPNRWRNRRISSDLFEVHFFGGNSQESILADITFIKNSEQVLARHIQDVWSAGVSVFDPKIIIDTCALLSAMANYEQEFATDLEFSEFVDAILLRKRRVSIACGNGSNVIGHTEDQLFQAVRQGNQEVIVGYLKSPSMEDRFLGLLAADFVKWRGEQISAEVEALYNQILDLEPEAYVCLNCTEDYWPYDRYLGMLRIDIIFQYYEDPESLGFPFQTFHIVDYGDR